MSAYRVRFVSRKINEAIAKHLFREVTIRLGWNRLFVNPPLRELADGTAGQVFREHARVLNLDEILLEDPPPFQDDIHRDHDYNRYLPTEVWYHYPEPMTKDEKIEKYEALMGEVCQILPAAIASMSKLVEIRYQVDFRSSSQWLGSAVSRGLSALSNIGTIRIQIQPRADCSQEDPLENHLQVIGSLKNLHTLEISVLFSHMPSGLDHLWRDMQATGIQLRSISVDDVSFSLLEYLASFTGLQHLTLSLLRPHGEKYVDEEEEMAAFLFKTVLARHDRTLSHLAIVGEANCWSINDYCATALTRCRALVSLTTSLCVLGQTLAFDIRKSLVRFRSKKVTVH
ncbi:hypothetical protein CPB83DRAFT_411763 [Crepidotus variabilis]|uniref:Uncharacterized protein n=1 Tax=Crepidotus variabilis TaxID=179855 RepID=A0A9P6EPX1_9AGAR|nr:hypothetical protein CPB83DRAFT_411763 [Crepidotus variabilis]